MQTGDAMFNGRKANEEAITEAFSLLQRVCRNAGINVASAAGHLPSEN